MRSLKERFRSAWNVFTSSTNPNYLPPASYQFYSGGYRDDRPRLHVTTERSSLNAVYNRIANDVAMVDIRHCVVDENKIVLGTVNSRLNRALDLDTNIDQTCRDLVKDIVISMFDEGKVAVVPVECELTRTGIIKDVISLRTGKIIEWFPAHIRVEVYNEKTGRKEQVIIEKRRCAIIENPFYSVMNESNSTLKRLVRQSNMLDEMNERGASNKLDIIVQLPYVIKTEARKQQAEKRRKELELQLADSKYGVAYTDGTEKIVQLNRPIENHLTEQIDQLRQELYGQLGITADILNNVANEATMNNYYANTLEPILCVICEAMSKKFLSPKRRARGEVITYFRDPLKMLPMSEVAKISDSLTRNAILTSNEIRGILGRRPSDDPSADQLMNKNIKQEGEEMPMEDGGEEGYGDEYGEEEYYE